MEGFTPEEVFAILRTARSPDPDPRLDKVLKRFRRDWGAVGASRFRASAADIDDATQEAWDRMTEPEILDRVRDRKQIETYGRRVFVNCLYDLVRTCGRNRGDNPCGGEGPSAEMAVVDPAERAMRLEILRRAMSEIPMIETIVKLRQVEGLTIDQVVERTGLSRRTVHRRIERLRDLLRRLLEGENE